MKVFVVAFFVILEVICVSIPVKPSGLSLLMEGAEKSVLESSPAVKPILKSAAEPIEKSVAPPAAKTLTRLPPIRQKSLSHSDLNSLEADPSKPMIIPQSQAKVNVVNDVKEEIKAFSAPGHSDVGLMAKVKGFFDGAEKKSTEKGVWNPDLKTWRAHI